MRLVHVIILLAMSALAALADVNVTATSIGGVATNTYVTDFPIYLYGDVGFLGSVFNSIAMLVKSSDAKIFGLFGIFVILIVTGWTVSKQKTITPAITNSIFIAAAVSSLIAPVTVHIIDERVSFNNLTPTSAYQKVDNVPFFLALCASASTSFSQTFIPILDDTYGTIHATPTPSQSGYGSLGFAGGIQLMEGLLKDISMIGDGNTSQFRESVQQYVTECEMKQIVYASANGAMYADGIVAPKDDWYEANQPSTLGMTDADTITDPATGNQITCSSYWDTYIGGKKNGIATSIYNSMVSKYPQLQNSATGLVSTYGLSGKYQTATNDLAKLQTYMLNYATIDPVIAGIGENAKNLKGIDLSTSINIYKAKGQIQTEGLSKFQWLTEILPDAMVFMEAVVYSSGALMLLICVYVGWEAAKGWLLNYAYGLLSFETIKIAHVMVNNLVDYYASTKAVNLLALNPGSLKGSETYYSYIATLSGLAGTLGAAAIFIVPGIIFGGRAMSAINVVAGIKDMINPAVNSALDTIRRQKSTSDFEKMTGENAIAMEALGKYQNDIASDSAAYAAMRLQSEQWDSLSRGSTANAAKQLGNSIAYGDSISQTTAFNAGGGAGQQTAVLDKTFNTVAQNGGFGLTNDFSSGVQNTSAKQLESTASYGKNSTLDGSRQAGAITGANMAGTDMGAANSPLTESQAFNSGFSDGTTSAGAMIGKSKAIMNQDGTLNVDELRKLAKGAMRDSWKASSEQKGRGAKSFLDKGGNAISDEQAMKNFEEASTGQFQKSNIEAKAFTDTTMNNGSLTQGAADSFHGTTAAQLSSQIENTKTLGGSSSQIQTAITQANKAARTLLGDTQAYERNQNKYGNNFAQTLAYSSGISQVDSQTAALAEFGGLNTNAAEMLANQNARVAGLQTASTKQDISMKDKAGGYKKIGLTNSRIQTDSQIGSAKGFSDLGSNADAMLQNQAELGVESGARQAAGTIRGAGNIHAAAKQAETVAQSNTESTAGAITKAGGAKGYIARNVKEARAKMGAMMNSQDTADAEYGSYEAYMADSATLNTGTAAQSLQSRIAARSAHNMQEFMQKAKDGNIDMSQLEGLRNKDGSVKTGIAAEIALAGLSGAKNKLKDSLTLAKTDGTAASVDMSMAAGGGTRVNIEALETESQGKDFKNSSFYSTIEKHLGHDTAMSVAGVSNWGKEIGAALLAGGLTYKGGNWLNSTTKGSASKVVDGPHGPASVLQANEAGRLGPKMVETGGIFERMADSVKSGVGKLNDLRHQALDFHLASDSLNPAHAAAPSLNTTHSASMPNTTSYIESSSNKSGNIVAEPSRLSSFSAGVMKGVGGAVAYVAGNAATDSMAHSTNGAVATVGQVANNALHSHTAQMAGMGAMAGMLGGPFAPVTGTMGAMVGGIMGAAWDGYDLATKGQIGNYKVGQQQPQPNYAPVAPASTLVPPSTFAPPPMSRMEQQHKQSKTIETLGDIHNGISEQNFKTQALESQLYQASKHQAAMLTELKQISGTGKEAKKLEEE